MLQGDVFPELRTDPQTVIEVIDDEEGQFLLTLSRGEKLFNKAVKSIPSSEKKFPGDVAWRLYDTYGFPLDLTQLMAEEHGLQVDLEEYEKKKKEAIVRGFSCDLIFVQIISSAGSGKFKGNLDVSVHLIDELKKKGIPSTDDSPKYVYTFDGTTDVNAQYGN